MRNYTITPLTEDRFDEAVELVLVANLDTREEIEHHLEKTDAHYIALDQSNKIIGVIGWYQDTMNYATEYYSRQGFKKIMEGKINNSQKIFMVKRW